MELFLANDLFRVDGATGAFLEREFADDSQRLSALRYTVGRNQYASFQIVFAPKSGRLNTATVDFPSLQGQAHSVPAACFEAYVEWFHRVEDALVPDMLLPFPQTPLTIPQDTAYLADQRVGALWVDLFIAKDTPAGLYRGDLAVSADGQKALFPLEVEVKAAVIPEGGRLIADLNNYADSLSPHFDSLRGNPDRYRDGSYAAVETAFHRMAREHRALFHNLPYRHSSATPECYLPALAGEGKTIRVASWDLFDRHFGPLLDGTAFQGSRVSERPVDFLYLPFNLGWPANYEKWGQKGYKTEYRRILHEFTRHFEEKSWDKTYLEILLNNKKDYRFYPYTIDEIWYEHDEAVVDTYFDIIRDIFEHSSARFLFRMDSSNHYGNHFDHRFSDYCKMWVAGWAMFNWFPESVAVMKNKGNILWIYGSVLRSMKESLLSLFVWPMQCLMTGATGFCVWNTTGFGSDPRKAPAALGSTALFYPGSPFGLEAPLPSIRLKALRNAMQTADLAMLAEGTPLKARVEAIVNRHFGLPGNDAWWREKPPFVNDSPRTWDFGEAMDAYCVPPLHRGRDPRIAHAIARDVLSLFSGEEDENGARVHFRFY